MAEASTIQNYVLAAAIDFGTTFSGYAYSFTDKQNQIILNKDWLTSNGLVTHKAPTAVLVDQIGNFVAFGHDALQMYYDKWPARVSYRLFCDNFKMELYGKEVIDKSTTIKPKGAPSRGKAGEMRLISVITMSLKYLYNHLQTALQNSFAHKIDHNLFRLVLTVPCMWTNGAKSFMRDAAIQAGLVHNDAPERLLFLSEPVAAAYWCRHLSLEDSLPREQLLALPEGTIYFVVDCGGGTIDISIHKILNDERVIELNEGSPQGGPWGGTSVNTRFEKEIIKHLGTDYVEDLAAIDKALWVNLMNEFERMKRCFKPEDSSEISTRPLSVKFAEVYKKLKQKGRGILSKKLQKKPTISFPDGSGYRYGDFKFFVSNGQMISLHEDVIKHIKETLTDLLLDSVYADAKVIYLVGGFSASETLYLCLQNNLENNIRKVVKPYDPDLAVLKGAVLYGHASANLTSRIACKTYGNNFVENGNKQAFTTWVAKSESVTVSDRKRFTFEPSLLSKKIEIDIYEADRDRVTNISERGVQKKATLTFDKQDHLTKSKVRRPIVLYVNFEETELHIEAEDTSTGVKQQTSIEFDCR